MRAGLESFRELARFLGREKTRADAAVEVADGGKAVREQWKRLANEAIRRGGGVAITRDRHPASERSLRVGHPVGQRFSAMLADSAEEQRHSALGTAARDIERGRPFLGTLVARVVASRFEARFHTFRKVFERCVGGAQNEMVSLLLPDFAASRPDQHAAVITFVRRLAGIHSALARGTARIPKQVKQTREFQWKSGFCL